MALGDLFLARYNGPEAHAAYRGVLAANLYLASVTAPSEAELTRRAYFASTPVV